MGLSDHQRLPRLRGVEVIPLQHEGQRAFYLRDPLEFAEKPLVLGPAGLFILSRLDGQHSVADVRAAFAETFPGGAVSAGEINDLIQALSEGHYLDDQASAQRIEQVLAEFQVAAVREAWHAGAAYPGAPDELIELLDGLYDGQATAHRAGGSLQAIVCPHIDLRVGGETYPPPFTALAAAGDAGAPPVELYVILGVAHNGALGGSGDEFVIASDKDFVTPLGRVACDRDVVADWSARAGRDLTASQWLHRTEHSIEFPLLFLQHAAQRATLAPYAVVPALLGSCDQHLAAGENPLAAPEIANELAALSAAVAASGKRALYVLSVDLAHIGPKFGDPDPVDDERAAACETADRELLGHIERFNADRFAAHLLADGNTRNIDAIAGLFALLALLPASSHGNLLGYAQNRQPDTGSLVSYGSMAIYAD